MSGEGKFFTTLGADAKTFIPGGAEVDGEIVTDESNYVHEFFNARPLCGAGAGAGAATGTTGDENICVLNNSSWIYHVLGTQTILGPTMGTYGMNIVQDEVEDDGVEYAMGITSHAKGVFTVGTDEAFYAKMRFYIDDVSGTDDCAFGFRKMEAFQANVDDYDEMAVLNVISGDITIETILNGGGTSTTDSTDDWADAATHTLEIYVSAAGVVTYKIDGVAPSTIAAFTFDDGEVVIPFFYQLQAADPECANLELIEFECGLQ